MIKYVIFDLADTLVSGLTGIENKLAQYINSPKEQILPCFRGPEIVELFFGNITEDEYLQLLIKKYNWDIDISIIKQIIRDNFNSAVSGVSEIVQKLSSNYTLVLLSNHCKEWIEYIERTHDFLKVFKYKFYSFEIKGTKDNPNTYISLLKHINCEPQNCVFIDDRQHFIDVAQSVGINAIRFDNAENLKLSLNRVGISI